jgi:beta-phosphoglucomutase-like phosphatase (HAD superfamily)
MSSGRAPFAALDDILSQTQHLLISFDGPVCSLFTGTASARIADSLREVFAQEGVRVPQTIEYTVNWLEVFSYAASVSPDLAARVESELTAMESVAVATATPTPYVHDVLMACRDSARPVAIISDHSATAVREYLVFHDLYGQISLISARTGPDTAALKPRPDLIRLAISELDTRPSACSLVGDSPTDIQAANAAGVHSIGYAKTSRDIDHLVDSGAGAIILSMADLALRLRARPSGTRPPGSEL